jgi:hypothetical protein
VAAQTLDQVIASLGSIYDPQIQNVQAQQAQLPQQLQNDESALQGQQTQAFDNILQGARRRGTGVAFGGIPLGEQAQYNATTYMPAAANLRSTYANKGLSLQDAINQINERRTSTGNQIYQFGVQQDLAERQFQEQQRQFNEQQAAAARAAAASAAGGFSPTYGGGDTGSVPTGTAKGAAQPQFIGNNDLRGHLLYLSRNGNNDATIALKYVGNDGKYNQPPTVLSPSVLAALNRIGAVNVYKGSTGAKPGTAIGGSSATINKILGK